ncbi:threonine/homoserine/homoserine lactone efflux protein [Nocardiopsis mwathae]|uniref:Threonine/homoserine/homoserine lactone efflux protein n=1 Tax=Nocardiopsis mwathae TaxID=1472723 RepID=A0A7X0D5F4_9ACTN|nr:LysE family translocator [Nocardiopsis mwathae]MBB6172352.1 threonine/homoserine/homoserine lactone efflux protein [Nocardiopsis mwathae]
MDIVQGLPAFIVAVVLISASPGPAMALIFRRAALHGFRSSVATVLGLEAGIYLWALAAGAGLAALLAASHTLYLTIQIAGACFLAYLGIRSWAAVLRDRRTDAADPGRADPPPPQTSTRAAFGEGLVVQLANPKAAVFMFAFYPQFISADQPLLATTAALALLQVGVETTLYLALAAGVARAGTRFRRPTIRRRLEAVTGTVLIALAGRLLLTAR